MKSFIKLLYNIHKYGALVSAASMLLSMFTFAFVQEIIVFKIFVWSFCAGFLCILGLGTVFLEMFEEDF